MAEQDFNLFAKIIPDKKQLEKDLEGVEVGTRSTNKKKDTSRGKDGDGGEEGVLSELLGPIGNLAKIGTALLLVVQAFKPFFKILEGFIKVLQLFFIPLNVLLIKLLAPLLKRFAGFTEEFVRKGLDFVDELVRSIRDLKPLFQDLVRFTKSVANFSIGDFFGFTTPNQNQGGLNMSRLPGTTMSRGEGGGPGLFEILTRLPSAGNRVLGNIGRAQTRGNQIIQIQGLLSSEILRSIRGQEDNDISRNTIG